ncbi:MAG: alpha/beta hydrolase family protein [Woeseiaceae bacterium]
MKVQHHWRCAIFIAVALMAGCAGQEVCRVPEVSVTELKLSHPDGRETRFSSYAPKLAGDFPLVVFSHGAFAAPDRYDVMLSAFATQGFLVIAPLHIDSEVLTQGDTPPAHALTWATRKADMQFAIQHADRLAATHKLARALPPSEGYLAAGHSYGAFVAQTLGGAVAIGEGVFKDDRLSGVIAFSPPGPIPGFIGTDAWDTLVVPQLVVTGTADVLPGFIEDWRAHAMAHERADNSEQWLWVGNDVDHYFGNVIGRLDREARPFKAAFDEAIEVAGAFAQQYQNEKSPNAHSLCVRALAPGETPAAVLTRR